MHFANMTTTAWTISCTEIKRRNMVFDATLRNLLSLIKKLIGHTHTTLLLVQRLQIYALLTIILKYGLAYCTNYWFFDSIEGCSDPVGDHTCLRRPRTIDSMITRWWLIPPSNRGSPWTSGEVSRWRTRSEVSRMQSVFVCDQTVDFIWLVTQQKLSRDWDSLQQCHLCPHII